MIGTLLIAGEKQIRSADILAYMSERLNRAEHGEILEDNHQMPSIQTKS